MADILLMISVLDLLVFLFFVFEQIIKITALGFRRSIKAFEGKLDFGIVSVDVLFIFLQTLLQQSTVADPKLVRMLRLMKLFRASRILRLAPKKLMVFLQTFPRYALLPLICSLELNDL